VVVVVGEGSSLNFICFMSLVMVVKLNEDDDGDDE
jgi:hypothetical protein